MKEAARYIRAGRFVGRTLLSICEMGEATQLENEGCPQANVPRKLPHGRPAVERVPDHVRVGDLLLRVVPFLYRLVERRSTENLAGEQRGRGEIRV